MMRRWAAVLAAPLLLAQAAAPATDAPAPALAPAPAPAPALAAPPPAEQELIYHGEAASLLGRTVRGPDDAAIGRIVDVLVDDAGAPRAAIVDAGGFMGMGSRRIAVAWRALRFLPAVGRAGRIVLDMTLDQIKGTPEFKRTGSAADAPVAVAAPPTGTAAPPGQK